MQPHARHRQRAIDAVPGQHRSGDLRALVRQNPGAVNVWTELVLLNQYTATVHHETI